MVHDIRGMVVFLEKRVQVSAVLVGVGRQQIGHYHRTAQRVMTMIENLHRTHGLTSVVATHNLELAHRADRLLRLADGELTEALVPPVR